ncbi:hypothetical protein AB0M97_22330 [Streptomyces sp. NPDC051207]|uniref:hypothetical protein n=1 Tax=Streptomyces sp. NPDC051207 TaxID=3154641 RepID=UPI0034431C08
MKLSPNTAPTEPDDLLIRFHNLVGAAVDVTGRTHGQATRWYCHGCAESSDYADSVYFTRSKANDHAGACRAGYHRIG